MTRLKLMVFSLLLPTFCFAQEKSFFKEDQMNQWGTKSLLGCQTIENEYTVLYSTDSSYIAYYDSLGNLKHTISATNLNNYKIISSGNVFCERYNSKGTNLFFDSKGNLLWDRDSNYYFTNLTELKPSILIAQSLVYWKDSTGKSNEVKGICRLDEKGDTTWDVKHEEILNHFSFSTGFHYLEDAVLLDSIIYALWSDVFHQNSSIVKLTLNGKLLSKKEFIGKRFKQLDLFKNQIILCSHNETHDTSWIGKIDTALNFTQLYSNGETILWFDDMKVIHDSIYFMESKLRDDTGRQELLNINLKGNILSRREFIVVNDHLLFKNFDKGLDGGVFFSGTLASGAESNFKKRVIAKMSSDGRFDDNQYGVVFLGRNYVNHINNLKIDIFPNPTSTFANFSLKETHLNFKIFGPNGQVLESGEFEESIQIDVSHFESGVYFVQFQGVGIEQIQSFIVQR